VNEEKEAFPINSFLRWERYNYPIHFLQWQGGNKEHRQTKKSQSMGKVRERF